MMRQQSRRFENGNQALPGFFRNGGTVAFPVGFRHRRYRRGQSLAHTGAEVPLGFALSTTSEERVKAKSTGKASRP